MPEPNKPFSVSELTKTIKSILSENSSLKNIWVRGEISSLSTNSSGHIYFGLKDAGSKIQCAYFYFQNRNYTGKKLTDGMEVQIQGSINVYEPGGYYNFVVSKVEELGRGDIFYQIEELKKKLDKLGIFDESNKKPIPKFIKTLGIATSSTGAAVEDIIRIAKERYPNLNILISPCQVQGELAPNSIVRAIEELNNPIWEVDVIIAGRGGGSYEDLMAFNDEKVVMAFYNSMLPIISAVGHQVDNLITDLAADLRAPTPTAAAEIAVPELSEASEYLDDLEYRLDLALKNLKDKSKEKLKSILNKRIFNEPILILADRSMRVDETLNKIFLLGKNNFSSKKNLLTKYEVMNLYIKALIEKKRKKFELGNERVLNFSPLETLKRGYSVLRNKNKEVITSLEQVKKGEKLEIILKDEKKLNVIVGE